MDDARKGRAHRGRLVASAVDATLSIEYGLILCSNDTGFDRFEGLARQNPLEG